jgi:hypothetical protein
MIYPTLTALWYGRRAGKTALNPGPGDRGSGGYGLNPDPRGLATPRMGTGSVCVGGGRSTTSDTGSGGQGEKQVWHERPYHRAGSGGFKAKNGDRLAFPCHIKGHRHTHALVPGKQPSCRKGRCFIRALFFTTGRGRINNR